MPSSRKSVPMPKSWPWLFFLFGVIGRRRLRKCFRAVRMLRPDVLQNLPPGPAIIYLNHPSWWDPIVCAELARQLLPSRKHYAPISATSLKEYPFFRYMGMFPVEQNSPRGAANFLRTAGVVLANNGILWITAQGHFTDARVRPVELKPGLGALLQRSSHITVVPLAVEYTFWNQRLPEVLLAAGAPLTVHEQGQGTAAEWTATLEHRLEQAQAALASASLARAASSFTTLLEGRAGMAGPYALWQRMQAAVRGETRVADHQDDAASTTIAPSLPAASTANDVP